MSTIRIPTSFNIDLEFQLPEFFRRFFAFAIDSLVIWLYLTIAGRIYKAIASSMDYSDRSMYDLAGYAGLLFLPVLCYHIVMEVTMNGQSVGKRLTGIRVVSINGGKPSFSQLMIRWLLREIWFFFVLVAAISSFDKGNGLFTLMMILLYFIVDTLLVIATKKNQRIGDMLAHTILIRTSSKADISETVFREVSKDYKPSFPQIMQLSDKDINAIKNIIRNANGRSSSITDRAADRIRQHLQIDSDLDSLQFLEILLNDYNSLSMK